VLALLERTEALELQGEATLSLGEALLAAGSTAGARETAAAALALFERKGNVVSAARARALVAELD
jgi:hypothetical protein